MVDCIDVMVANDSIELRSISGINKVKWPAFYELAVPIFTVIGEDNVIIPVATATLEGNFAPELA